MFFEIVFYDKNLARYGAKIEQENKNKCTININSIVS